MNKDTKKHGQYFTFPLKFLWVTPEEIKQRCNQITAWSVIWYTINRIHDMDREKAFNEAQKQLHVVQFDYNWSWQKYQELNKLITGGEIYTSVKTSYLFDTREGKFNPDLLRLVAAVKSVIGKRNFAKTYRNIIVQRMYGEDSGRMTRYSFNKLCDEAISRRMFTRIPAGRGFFVSTRYDVTDLHKVITTKIKNYHEKKIRAAEAGQDIAMLKREYQQKYRKTPQVSPEF